MSGPGSPGIGTNPAFVVGRLHARSTAIRHQLPPSTPLILALPVPCSATSLPLSQGHSTDPFSSADCAKSLRGDKPTTESECKADGDSPPRGADGTVADLDETQARIKADGFDSYFRLDQNDEHVRDQQRILRFMYGIEFFRNKKEIRKEYINKMLDTSGEPFKRAKRFLLMRSDMQKDQLDIDPELLEYVRRYGLDGTGYNVHSNKRIVMMQRVQKSGTCFLHAPVTTQGYLVQMQQNETESDATTINIGQYVRHNFGDEALARLLVTDTGGSSEEHFINILEEAWFDGYYSKPSAERLFKNVANPRFSGTTVGCGCFPNEGSDMDRRQEYSLLEHNLRTYGPALVSSFACEDKFSKGKTEESHPGLKYFHGKARKIDELPLHAMVLVGVREVESGNDYRVLLQNWWPTMPFVEVSREYFISSRARVTFVKAPQHSIPEQFDRYEALYAEADLEGCDYCLL